MKDDDEAMSPGEAEDDGPDPMKDLVRNALRDSDPPKADVLSGVQKKIRQRSAGKFYADFWSTAKQPPIATYLITSLIMLAIIFVIYAVLSPLRGQAKGVSPEPVPVHVLPPR